MRALQELNEKKRYNISWKSREKNTKKGKKNIVRS